MVGKGKQRKLRQFDVIATNPPFAGDISSDDTLSRYELAFKVSDDGRRKRVNKLARDKMFIEMCLKSLKAGGRMAIVLPRGTLKNYNDEFVRRHVIRRAKIVAVVSLTGYMFKPFTNTKTCILFLEKRLEELADLNEAESDPPIVFAVSTNPGKDKSGKLTWGEDGFVDSDLNEIAEYVNANATWSCEESKDATT